MAALDDVAVIIPAYNAGTRLETVLSKTLAIFPKGQIVVVNDGSTDATATVAVKFGIPCISHDQNRGKGAALKTGFGYALTRPNIRAVISMDADGQHDPVYLPEFVRVFRETSVDLIIGCRQIRWPAMPLFRVISNRLTSALVSWRLGKKIPDSQSGYRLHSRRLLERLKLQTSGYQMESELLLKAVQVGMRVGFIAIATIYAGETSHIRGWRDTWRFNQMWFSPTK